MKIWFKIKNPITYFFIKLTALGIAWETCYIFLLKPIRIPDKFLTSFISWATTLFLNLFASNSHNFTYVTYGLSTNAFIQQDGKTVLIISDYCNSLDLIVIYLALIILLPYQWKRKLIFGICGTAIIIFANIIRCIVLYWIWVYHRSSFEINHHYH